MPSASGSSSAARWLDDYIEEVAVGTPWWILILSFGLGMPILAAVVGLVFHLRYQPGTYVVTFVVGCAFGLGLRLIARERERYRAAILDRSGSLRALRQLGWHEFEIAVGEALRRHGYPIVKERGGFQADGGIDLVAEGHKKRVAVQCKHWRAWTVSAPRVRELYGSVKAGNYSEGWLVTCGAFTSAARSWAAGKELRLIDGQELAGFIGDTDPVTNAATAIQTPAPQAPECPNCTMPLQRLTNTTNGSRFWGCTSHGCGWTFNDAPVGAGPVLCDRGHTMVERRTRRGIAFWGCSTYPACQRKRLSAIGASK